MITAARLDKGRPKSTLGNNDTCDNDFLLFIQYMRSRSYNMILVAMIGMSSGLADDLPNLRSSPPVLATAQPAANQVPFIFNGYVVSEGKTLLGLSTVDGKWFGWFEPNTSRHGVTVISHDSKAMTVTLRGAGQADPITLNFSAGLAAQGLGKFASDFPHQVETVSPLKVSPITGNEPDHILQHTPVQLPPAVHAMMFPEGTVKQAPVLSHPAEAAAFLEEAGSTIPSEVARYFPKRPAPLWQHADPARNAR